MGLYVNQRFGRWTVLGTTGSKIPCRCDCGTERLISRYSLTRGDGKCSRSCGCLQRELMRQRNPNHRRHVIEPGDRFTRWTVVDATDWNAVVCRCECGAEGRIPASNLYGGRSFSCGCLRDEKAVENGRATRKHGHAGTPIYACWKHMMRRCTNPLADEYPLYGGRGITVHPAWHDAGVFVREVEAEIGPMPPKMTLDRVNNDANYEPGNIRWATRLAQSRNRRSGWDSRRSVAPGDLKAVRRNRTKLTHEQLTELLKLVESGTSQTDAASQFGISQPHVSRLVRQSRQAM